MSQAPPPVPADLLPAVEIDTRRIPGHSIFAGKVMCGSRTGWPTASDLSQGASRAQVSRWTSTIAVLVMFLMLGCTRTEFRNANDENDYLRTHPDDWQAHENLANRLGSQGVNVHNDPRSAVEHLIAMKVLAKDWMHDSESQARYLDIEERYVWSLSSANPPQSRLAALDQLIADRHAAGRWVPGDPLTSDTVACAEFLISYHLLRGYALADLGMTDEATASLLEGMPMSIRDLSGKASLLKVIVKINCDRAAWERTRGDTDQANHYSTIAEGWESKRREAVIASDDQTQENRASSQAIADYLHSETLEMEGERDKRDQAERDRIADLVPCPVCGGNGGFDVQHVETQDRNDGPHQVVVSHSSLKCVYCINGWVRKEDVADILRRSR